MEIFGKTAVFPGGYGRIAEMLHGGYGRIGVYRVKGPFVRSCQASHVDILKWWPFCLTLTLAIALTLGETSKFPHTSHKKPSVSSHTLAPTTICDLSHSVCRSPLTDLGHISSVTYVCHPLWFVCGHRKGILTSPLRTLLVLFIIKSFLVDFICP